MMAKEITMSRDDYMTPPWLITAVDEVLDPIELDPCWHPSSDVYCYRKVTKSEDILKKKDIPYGLNVFLNPPYSKPLCSKIIDWFLDYHSVTEEEGLLSRSIVLVNSSTETAWYQKLLKHCQAMCFFNKRIQFGLNGDFERSGNNRYAQTAFFFEILAPDRIVEFRRIFSEFGTVIYNDQRIDQWS